MGTIMSGYDEHAVEIDRRVTELVNDEVLAKLKKRLDDELVECVDHVIAWVQDNLRDSINATATRRAEFFIDELLAGNIEHAERSFGLKGYTGRREEKDASVLGPVIWGRYNLSGPEELRAKIVESHANLIRDEYVKDLECRLQAMEGQIRALQCDLYPDMKDTIMRNGNGGN